ncbi:glycosyl transferase family 2 [Mucilaginibacter yixingensis]|uniref:Glycosyl transferase family 2 n=1 Tax=Mucilaginibacter yixingensis TaxID=1295612 RepID=A0A2T5JC35_9SPHI|nr:glycosyltransferase family A protein [Mucilaginibacter yixingensis]PTQ99331.1 glycosyl transferase family 2 [Mucilaginibacter yixingensis]
MFSIALPAYKSKFLKECISSILAQTYTDFELIIVNDCSPEPIDEIVSQFSDPRIKYFINETNIGGKNLVDNWNNCLDKASREFFVMMGDDDRMDTIFLEEFARLIDQHPDLDVYHCRCKILNEHSEFTGFSPSCPDFESVYDNIWHRLNGHRLQFVSDFLYRTEPLKQRGGYYKLPLAWGSDDITAYTAMGQKGVAHINKAIFQYRSHSTSISSSGSQLLKMDAVMGQAAWYINFLETIPANPDDIIQRQVLIKSIKKLIQKKKLVVLINSMQANLTGAFFKWLKVRNQYQFSVVELVYAALESIKKSKSKSK